MSSPLSHQYRRSLRSQLSVMNWENMSWARTVLAAEIVQGWAGRKQQRYCCAQLRVYHTREWNEHSQDAFVDFIARIEFPGTTILSPIRWTSKRYKQNRVPLNGDTQDRFWLLRDPSYLEVGKWNHWLITKEGWGCLFHPSQSQAWNIYTNDALFDSTMHKDWYYHSKIGEESYWVTLVLKYAELWPLYAAILQLNKDAVSKAKEDDIDVYKKFMFDLRNLAQNPEKISEDETWRFLT